MAIQLPDRSTLAGGLAGLLAWGASLALASQGIVIPDAVLFPFVVSLMTLVTHYVPDAAKVDAEIKQVASIIPQTYKQFPAPKEGAFNEPPIAQGTPIENINKS